MPKPRPTLSSKQELPFSLDMTCTICLRQFYDNEGNVGMIISCGHYYHLKCITTWLEENKTCPNCRIEVSNIEITSLLYIIQCEDTKSTGGHKECGRVTPADPMPSFSQHSEPFQYNEHRTPFHDAEPGNSLEYTVFMYQETDDNDINIQLQEIYNKEEREKLSRNVQETSLNMDCALYVNLSQCQTREAQCQTDTDEGQIMDDLGQGDSDSQLDVTEQLLGATSSEAQQTETS